MTFRHILLDIRSVLFPQQCHLCNNLLSGSEEVLCMDCISHLPYTLFNAMKHNPMEERFLCRIPFGACGALLHFKQHTASQKIVHQIKYHGDLKLAHVMGRMIGIEMASSHRFDDVDVLLPVPLHPRKKLARGYNQSLELCKGIVSEFPRPIESRAVVRTRYTGTQTRRGRIARMDNMANVFEVANPKALYGKHILVFDDVITSGATVEACCQAILDVPTTKVSIFCLAMAAQ